MTFERLKGKINVLEIVRQRVPGCGTGVGKRRLEHHQVSESDSRRGSLKRYT